MSVRITVLGLEEAQTYFDSLPLKLQSEVALSLDQVCQEIAAYARSIAPVKTGGYAASIYSRVEGEWIIAIGSDYPVAGIIEHGSMPHYIEARGRALRFEVDGETVFAKWVMHPGTRGQLIIHRAVQDNLPRIVEAVRMGVEKALRE